MDKLLIFIALFIVLIYHFNIAIIFNENTY